MFSKNQKIIFVSVVDNHNKTVPDLGCRIWQHMLQIKDLLETETCIIGRKTYDVTQWKGPKSWVMTRNPKWHKSGIGTLHSLEDIRLFCDDGPIYIIGGNSLFHQLKDYVQEIHFYILNHSRGVEDWIPIDMNNWKPSKYKSESDIWTYAHLTKIKRRRSRINKA